MLSRVPKLTSLSLRRFASTSTTSSVAAAGRYDLERRRRLAMLAMGGAAAFVSFTTWKLGDERNTLALDGETPANPKPKTRTVKKVAAEATDASAVPESDASPSEEQAPEGEDTGAASGGGGAYNPETGEINWDCPCLGGMADGPCGEEFREAFSCFIYSDQEPKGIECVEKFKGMQECFRKHPEVYSDQIMDEDPEEEDTAAGIPAVAESSTPAAEAPSTENVSSPTPSS